MGSYNSGRRSVYNHGRSNGYEYCVSYLNSMKTNPRFKRMEKFDFDNEFSDFVARNFLESSYHTSVLKELDPDHMDPLVDDWAGHTKGIMDAYKDYKKNGDLHSKKKK